MKKPVVIPVSSRERELRNTISSLKKYKKGILRDADLLKNKKTASAKVKLASLRANIKSVDEIISDNEKSLKRVQLNRKNRQLKVNAISPKRKKIGKSPKQPLKKLKKRPTVKKIRRKLITTPQKPNAKTKKNKKITRKGVSARLKKFRYKGHFVNENMKKSATVICYDLTEMGIKCSFKYIFNRWYEFVSYFIHNSDRPKGLVYLNRDINMVEYFKTNRKKYSTAVIKDSLIYRRLDFDDGYNRQAYITSALQNKKDDDKIKHIYVNKYHPEVDENNYVDAIDGLQVMLELSNNQKEKNEYQKQINIFERSLELIEKIKKYNFPEAMAIIDYQLSYIFFEAYENYLKEFEKLGSFEFLIYILYETLTQTAYINFNNWETIDGDAEEFKIFLDEAYEQYNDANITEVN